MAVSSRRNLLRRPRPHYQASDRLGNLRDYQFDANGNPISQRLALSGNQVDSSSQRYDDSDRPIAATMPAATSRKWPTTRPATSQPDYADGYSLAPLTTTSTVRWRSPIPRVTPSVRAATRSADRSPSPTPTVTLPPTPTGMPAATAR